MPSASDTTLFSAVSGLGMNVRAEYSSSVMLNHLVSFLYTPLS